MTEPVLPVATSPGDSLAAGLAALGRHAWKEAFDLLASADREGTLSGADLERFAEAAFFAGQAARGGEIKERAFKAHLDAADDIRAAFMALQIAHDYGMSGKLSIASAWAGRGARLLQDKPESYAHGYLALIQSEKAGESGEIDVALASAEQAAQIATRTNHADLHAAALVQLGMLTIGTGAAAQGMVMMEEAAISAVNGELSPVATGTTCCRMIAACRDLTDYRRASEWTEATENWCERESISGFPGVCRIHRAEVVALGGAWDRAEQELRRAADELGAYPSNPPLADGLYALGEIRRLKGDLEGAESAFREAHGLGRTPQPGLALIRFAEGKTRAAATAINSAVKEETWDQWATARLLPAQVEIAIATGDLALARSAAEQLATIVDKYPSPALQAGKRQALGRVLLVEGDAAGATHEFRAAIRDWREVTAPYEVAKGRALLAGALRAQDDDDAADLELQAARDEFERLGAQPDVVAAAKELRVAADRRSGPVQVHKTFMFTDIVGSTNLAEVLGDEPWERLLAWHDDTLRDLVRKGRGEIVKTTGDGFFVAFDGARPAIDCAVSIQRALAEHRRTTGFALSVRIGLHAAAANRRGDDYSGMGVHVAARVAGLGGAEEIVASADTLAEAGDVAASEPRDAAVKGVTAPIRVASVSWA
jgi:class 3 adenylate cyclase/TolA-binding protein